MNLNYLAKRILGRSTCILAKGAKIGPKARIMNVRDSSQYLRIGCNSLVNGELCVLAHGGEIEIGERCYIDIGTRIWSGASIKIEDDVIIGPNVNVFDNISHPISAKKRHEHAKQIFTTGHPKQIDLDDKPIRIGRGTIIGAGSFVLRGVTIGENVLVAPGSIVTKSFP